MSAGHLVQMANDIANFFAAEPDREIAVAGIADHIRRFWDPRMRRQLTAHLQAGGADLSMLAREAAERLQREQAAV